MQGRELSGYWWVWQDGDEWPSWYYGQKTAKESAERKARSAPGRRVLYGSLVAHEELTLPDKLMCKSA